MEKLSSHTSGKPSPSESRVDGVKSDISHEKRNLAWPTLAMARSASAGFSGHGNALTGSSVIAEGHPSELSLKPIAAKRSKNFELRYLSWPRLATP